MVTLKEIMNPETINAMQRVNEQMLSLQRAIAPTLSKQILPALSVLEEVRKQTQPLASVMAEMERNLKPYQDAVKSIQQQLQPFSQQLVQLQSFQSSIDLSKIYEAVRPFAEAIKNIPPEYFIKMELHSDYWLINNHELIAELANREDDATSDKVQYIISYYADENWLKLEEVINSWEQGSSISERFPVIKAALNVAKSSSEEDIHLITIPALIAQIDGLTRDLYGFLPKNTKKRLEKEIRDNLPEAEKNNRRKDLRNEISVHSIAELVDFWTAEALQEIIFGGLFRTSKMISNDNNDNFSLFRHKIMHGDKEFLSYGNTENFIRLFLYADFLIKLIQDIQSGAMEVESVV